MNSYTWNVLVMYLGALVGWLTHPIVWLPLGFTPFRALHYLGVSARQESGWNKDASGDGGNSVGILQFNVKTWPALTGLDLEERKNCFKAGYYAIVFIQDALLHDWMWWVQLRVPVYGIAALRWMWTHGVSKAPSPAEAWDTMKKEGQTWKWYWYLLPLFGFLSVSLLGSVAYFGYRAKRRRG